MSARRSTGKEGWARLRWAPLVLATALLAQRSIAGILAKVGHPGPTLDDAYIHFQYARAFAEGHPFRFQAGEAISTGATSFLWPFVLAPFHALGFRDASILWPAWALSYLALGGLAYEAARLTRPLATGGPAIGAGALVLGFGGHAWCAASGMEVVPFAWLIATTLRRAAEWAEGQHRLRPLLVVAVLCPLMRPEGALVTLATALVVGVYPRPRGLVAGGRDLSRVEALYFVGAALVPNLLFLALTGHPMSSTAQVKLLFGNPYFDVRGAALANARLLAGTILDGQVWSAEFLPKGGALLAGLGLVATAWRGWATGRGVRAALVVLFALAMFVPCFYVTFLWNRLRYLWPFATGWFVGLACLARVLGDLIARVDRRAGAAATTLVVGGFAGALVGRLEWVLEDVAQSASGIDRQQAALGRWARANLPADARIGVNDTGAIAYFSDRKTFDVVGLTTPTEGRYWVAGAASRIEHYERLRLTPGTLPTHFIVYPEWMGCDPVIGQHLHEATVTDASILGGQTMRVSIARWDGLGTGELPWTKLAVVHDTLDVADLESEQAHAYDLLGAHEGEQVTREENAPDGALVLDGGRTRRLQDRFFARLPPGPLVAVMRVESEARTLEVRAAGRPIATVSVPSGPWSEVRFDVPPETRGDRVEIEVRGAAAFTSFHYWFGAP